MFNFGVVEIAILCLEFTLIVLLAGMYSKYGSIGVLSKTFDLLQVAETSHGSYVPYLFVRSITIVRPDVLALIVVVTYLYWRKIGLVLLIGWDVRHRRRVRH